MRAVQLTAVGGPVQVRHDHPEPAGAEIVDILACGVCHTDLHALDGDFPVRLPLILGHEITAVHPELGPVMVYAPWGCGTCRECDRGLENICAEATEAGLVVDGGYADRIAVPDRRYLAPLDGLDPIRSAPLACAGLTAYRAVAHVLDDLRRAPNGRVLVIGAGGLGQFAIRFLRLLSDAEISVVDRAADKLDQALEIGAHGASSDAAELGRFDAVIDFVGAPATVDSGVAAVHKGGHMVIVGVGGGTAAVGFGAVPHEARFQSSVWGSRVQLDQLLDLARRESEVLGRVETLPLEDAQTALDRLRVGSVSGRIVLTVAPGLVDVDSVVSESADTHSRLGFTPTGVVMTDPALPVLDHPEADELDVTEGRQYLDGIPHDKFTRMRAMDGLYWHPYGDSGFWAVTRADDVRTVSTTPEVFSSGLGHTNLWDLDGEALEARRSIIDSDAPDHTRLRRIVSKAFTPKSLRRWEGATRAITRDVLDDFEAVGQGNWVDLVAAPLPIRVILTILGVPLQDADHMIELSNYLIEVTGDEVSLPDDAFGNTTPVELLPFSTPASHALFAYGDAIGAERSANPTDDLVSLLVAARDREERLSAQEYRNFFHVLILGGNETTRTAISHGAMALAANPDQWARLERDRSLVDSAVEEVLRWATPLMYMRRTAAVDTRLAGTDIAAGDKVVMWYSSANRDDTWFGDPFRFDVGRAPNEHQSFGGGGPHFCLGAFLARMELRILLEEMLDRGIRLEQRGEPQRAPSNFVHGVLAVEMGIEGRS